jgi:hypothetical protein
MEKLDAVGNPIPEDLECPGSCVKYRYPHTHVRGNWNRPGYARLGCEEGSSCHHDKSTHFHKVDENGRYSYE